jgi:hypothetical protein
MPRNQLSFCVENYGRQMLLRQSLALERYAGELGNSLEKSYFTHCLLWNNVSTCYSRQTPLALATTIALSHSECI